VAAVAAMDTSATSSLHAHFTPPQVRLRRSNVATDRISDRFFEAQVRGKCGHLLWCARCSLSFVPPQVRQQRANIATDRISDRFFELSERRRVLRRRRSLDQQGGLDEPPCIQELRRKSFCSSESAAALASIARPALSWHLSGSPAHADLGMASVAPPPSPYPDSCRARRKFQQARTSRRCRSGNHEWRIACFGSQNCCTRESGSSLILSEDDHPDSHTTDLMRIARLGCKLSIAAAAIPVTAPLRASLPAPESSTAERPPGPDLERQAAHTDQPWCEPEAVSDAAAAADSSRRFLEERPGEMEEKVTLEDLFPQQSRRRKWRRPSLSRVCPGCQIIVEPPRGYWLRHSICRHRRPRACEPMLPYELVLLETPKQRHRRRRRLRRFLLAHRQDDGDCNRHIQEDQLKRRREIAYRGCKRCHHGKRRGRCQECGPHCAHGLAVQTCSTCRTCHHGRLKESCSVCSGCRHGLAKGACLQCNGCPHSRLRSACVECRPCPHGRLRGNCPECHSCPHGRLRPWCVECSACKHGRVALNCPSCKGCPHGLLPRFCLVCTPCPHGRRKDHCAECAGCNHGVVKSDCRICSACAHGHVRRYCALCNPCPHGKRKQSCTICSGCPHGRISDSCPKCNGCQHGRVRRFCKICNGCMHGKLPRFCQVCKGTTRTAAKASRQVQADASTRDTVGVQH